MSAGGHWPICCSSSMKKVLTDNAVPVRMLKVPEPVEFFTVYGGYETPVLQFS